MYVSLCLIAKDENTYLKEWLDYHILLGVEHFWIYDNDSSTPLEKTIKSYIDKGWATVNKVQGAGMQVFAYDHCIQTYGHLSQWIGFIDTDEFIIPSTTDSIPEFLKDYEGFGGLALHCLFFGSSGQQKRPRCGQVAGYLQRTPPSFIRNRLVKSIVQPSRVLFPLSPHSFMYSEGNYCVNEAEYRVDDQFFPVHVSKIQLNHYYTRSQEEMDEKKRRGRGDGGKAYPQKNWDDVNTYSSETDDLALNLIIKKLKLPPALARNTLALTDPLSTKILEELSKAAQQYQPPACQAEAFASIEKRKEMDILLTEHISSMEYIANGQIREARDQFYKLIQEYPFELIHYTNFSSACVQLNELPAAWEALSKAWKISPRDWLVLKCMMDYFYAVGNYEQVEKCATLMNVYGDLEPISMAGLIVALWKQGKEDEAK
ncbi:MAG TPA: glycosyltransferase family 92 protein, partial [Leptolinea sp.]